MGCVRNAVQSPFGSAHPRRCLQILNDWSQFPIFHGIPYDGFLEVSTTIPCNIFPPSSPTARTPHNRIWFE